MKSIFLNAAAHLTPIQTEEPQYTDDLSVLNARMKQSTDISLTLELKKEFRFLKRTLKSSYIKTLCLATTKVRVDDPTLYYDRIRKKPKNTKSVMITEMNIDTFAEFVRTESNAKPGSIIDVEEDIFTVMSHRIHPSIDSPFTGDCNFETQAQKQESQRN
jgi:hypothetical protein